MLELDDSDPASPTTVTQLGMTVLTGAEFRAIRERTGLTLEWLAPHLSVTPKTVARWDSGLYAVSAGATLTMQHIARTFEAEIDERVQRLERTGGPHTLVTYRTDAAYRASDPPIDVNMPAAWHRALTDRVAAAVPGTRVKFADEGEPRSTVSSS